MVLLIVRMVMILVMMRMRRILLTMRKVMILGVVRMVMILLIMRMVMILVMNVLEISTDFGNIIPLVSLLMLILMFCRLAFSRPYSILFICSRSPYVRCLRCPHPQRTRREENGS